MNADTIISYFNYAILGILALGMLSGFMKGTFKSIYAMVTSLVIIVFGWMVSDKIVQIILDINLSSYNLAFQLNGKDIVFTTLSETIANVIAVYSNTDVSTVLNLELYLFVMAVVKIPVKIIFILLLLLINYTLFNFIFWIVWLIIKPSKKTVKNSKGRKVKVKAKPSFISRLCGAGVGLVHTLVASLVFIVPICALCTVGESMGPLFDEVLDNSSTEEKISLTIGDDGKIYSYSNGSQQDISFIEPYVEFMKKYNETYASKIYSVIKIDGKPIDYYLARSFEMITYTKDDKKVELDIPEELSHVVKIYAKLLEEGTLSGDIKTNILELDQQAINYIFDEISQLQIINIAVPIGVEYLNITGTLDKELEGLVSNEDLKVVLANISAHNIAEELKHLGYGAGEVLSAIQAIENPPKEDDGSIDYISLIMQLDETKVQNALNYVAKVEVIDEVSDLLLNYLNNSGQLDEILIIKPVLTETEDMYYALDGVKTAVKVTDNGGVITMGEGYWLIDGIKTNVEIDKSNRLTLSSDGVKLTDNIQALGSVYSSFKRLGITSFDDFESSIKDNENLTDTNIDELSNALFNMTLISKNTKVLSSVITNVLPNEYSELLTIDDINKSDISTILKLGVILVDNGILDKDNELNYMNLLLNDGNKLIDLMYESDIITQNIDPIIRTILESVGSDILNVPSKDELDFSTNAGKDELLNLLDAMHLLFDESSDVDSLDANYLVKKLISLTDGTSGGEDQVGQLISSKILKDTIIMHLEKMSYNEETNPEGVLVINLDKEAWNDTFENGTLKNEGELRKLIKVIKKVFEDEENIDINNLKINKLLNKVKDDEFVDALLASTVLSDTVIKYLYDYKYDEVTNPDGILVINLDKTSPEWKDTTEEGELRKLFTVITKLFNDKDVDFDEISSDAVLNKVKDDEFVDALLASTVLSDTVIKYLYDYKYDEVTKPDGILVINLDKTSPEWKDTTEEGELRKLFTVITKLFNDKDVDFDEISSDAVLNKVKDDEFVDALLASTVLSDTVIKYLYDYKYDEVTKPDGILVINLDKTSPEWKDTTEEGELRKIFKGIKTIFKDDVNLDSIDANIILDLTDPDISTIMSSDIFEDTFRKQLLDLNGESIVVDEIHINTKENLTNEIVSLKNAIEVILDKDPITGKIDLNNPSVNVDNILSLSEDNKSKLISSYIISDTIIKEIKQNDTLVVQRSDYNWYGTGGELDNLLISVGLIFTGESLNSFSVNSILEINNKFNEDDDEIDDLLKSLVLRDTIVTEIIKLDSTGSVDENIIVKEHDVYSTAWDDDLINSKPGEIRNLLTSVKILLGDSCDLTNPNVTFDTVFEKSEDEINKMFVSEIISDTVSLQVYNMTQSATVRDYIYVNGTTKDEKLVAIKEDQTNLIIVLKRLNSEHGIKYDSFSFDTFQNAILTDSDADNVAATMVESAIITSSLTPMMKNIMSQVLSVEDYALLNFELEEDMWKPQSDNPGELALLLRNIPSIENITSIISDPNITDKTVLTNPLIRVNHSTVLHNLLPKYTESALGKASSWRSSADVNEFSVEVWDEEINTLGNIVVTINTNNVDLGNIEVTGSSAIAVSTLQAILLSIVPSRIIEIDNIRSIILTGVNEVFSSTYTLEDLGSVTWTPIDDWSKRTSAWNLEVVSIINAVESLQDVSDSNITSVEVLSTPAYDEFYVERDIYEGVYNARFIGRFLDYANKSVILEPLVDKIGNNVLSTIGVDTTAFDENALYEHQFRYTVMYYIKAIELLPSSGYNPTTAKANAQIWMENNFIYE